MTKGETRRKDVLVRHAVQVIQVAVGTIIADRPPHRSVRAGLPHTAPTLDESRQSESRDRDAELWAAAATAQT
jgi:riboflavin biosynthesis pyrimidine reductase